MRYIFILLLPILAFGASFIETEDCITLQGDTDYILIKKSAAYIPPILGIIVHDYSGNGNDGTIYGDPVLANGKLTFDGVDDYIDAGLYPDDNWQWELKVKYLSSLPTRQINGVYSSSGSSFAMGYLENMESSVVVYGDRNIFGGLPTNYWPITTTYILSNTVFYANGNILSAFNYNWAVKSTNTIAMGARNARGLIQNFANEEVLYSKIYTNNVLIQHFDFTK